MVRRDDTKDGGMLSMEPSRLSAARTPSTFCGGLWWESVSETSESRSLVVLPSGGDALWTLSPGGFGPVSRLGCVLGPCDGGGMVGKVSVVPLDLRKSGFWKLGIWSRNDLDPACNISSGIGALLDPRWYVMDVRRRPLCSV